MAAGPKPLARPRADAIERYTQSLADVPGWLDAIDFLVLQMVDQIQDHLGITGDILEIGAYQGRTAILLGYLCRENETLAVCDVFEHRTGDREVDAERDEFYADLTRDSFARNFLRCLPTLPEIHQCDSQELAPRIRGHTFRLVHLDGSHRHAVVRSDLRLAKEVTASGGVVAVDDYRREHTPGVAAAAWEQVASGGLVPICLTAGKLYGCWQDAERYLEGLRALTGSDPGLRTEEQLIGGHRVVRISDASIVGLSREEHFAVRCAELQREWQVEREAGAQDLAAARAEVATMRGELGATQGALADIQRELASRQAELAELRGDIARTAAALQRKGAALELSVARFERARQEVEERGIELAKQGLRNEDLRLHLGLLELALGHPGGSPQR